MRVKFRHHWRGWRARAEKNQQLLNTHRKGILPATPPEGVSFLRILRRKKGVNRFVLTKRVSREIVVSVFPLVTLHQG